MFKQKYLIKEKHIDSNNVLIIKVVPKNGAKVFVFRPGQYAMISFFDKNNKLYINHPFSIVSSPTQKDFLQFGIKIIGNFTQSLSKLDLGSELKVMGPYGKFVFDENKHKNAIFIAGGIGVTPFISSIRYAYDSNLDNKMLLFYSSRYLNNISFFDELVQWQKDNLNFKAFFSITGEDLKERGHFFEQGHIDTEMLQKRIGQVIDKDFFICGPSGFMKAMKKNLQSINVPSKKIHEETFSLSPKLPFRENYINLLFATGLSALIFFLFLNFVQPIKKNTLAPKMINDIDSNKLIAINNYAVARREGIILAKQDALNATGLILAEQNANISNNLNNDEIKTQSAATDTKAPINKTLPNTAQQVKKTNDLSSPSSSEIIPSNKVLPTVSPKPVVPQPTIIAPLVTPPPQEIPQPTTRVS